MLDNNGITASRGIVRADGIETPALLVDMDILEVNINKMAGYFDGKKAKLRPHFKTFKCPAIAHMMLAAGAKGITCAKLGEAQVLAEAGVQDILIANQIVDRQKIGRLAGLAKTARMSVCVDDPRNVDDLSAAAKAHGSTIHVLIEVDVGMGRCGINTGGEALALAQMATVFVPEDAQRFANRREDGADPDAMLGVVTRLRSVLADAGFSPR